MTQTNRGQLIDQALQRVGNNASTMRYQAAIRLDRILQDLYQGWDWPFLWATASLTIQPNGTLLLPADFLKPEDDQSLTVFVDSSSVPMQEVDHKTFAQRSTDYVGRVPRLWTIDYRTQTTVPDPINAPGVTVKIGPFGLAWPRPDTPCPALLRYKFLPPDIPFRIGPEFAGEFAANLNDIPIFPWDSFLTDAIAEWAMAYEADPRRAEQITINEAMLQRLRGATWPERSYPTTIPLDPMVFSTPSWGSGRE